MNTLSVTNEHLTSYSTLNFSSISSVEKKAQELYCTYIVFFPYGPRFATMGYLPPQICLGYNYSSLVREPRKTYGRAACTSNSLLIYFLVIVHIFCLYTSFCPYGEASHSPPLVRTISFVFVNLKDTWSCCVCFDFSTLFFTIET